MSKQIYITRQIPEIAVEMLRAKGYSIDMNMKETVPTQADIIEALQRKPYDAVITLLTDKINAKVFDALPNMKLFANYATGFDNIDIVEAKKRGILVTNTPGNYAYCIAEHTIALMIGLTTRMVEADTFVRAGKYQGWNPMLFIGTDLEKKTIGLIGAGRIGERVAHHASRGFDMSVIYYDVVRNEKIEKEYGAKYYPKVEDVLKLADVVSLHVPLLDSTRYLINDARLKIMKPTAFLINTSRGPVVDEKALVKALQRGTIRGAGLDVFECEPKLAEGLAELPNVILTPHIASARESARNEMARIVAENVVEFLEKGMVKNLVY